jgi:hypothetical protein
MLNGFIVAIISMFGTNPQTVCKTFQVASGTGCDWMCNYCAANVGPNYYFTTDVCKYENTGCVGTPLPNVEYTCCSTENDM